MNRHPLSARLVTVLPFALAFALAALGLAAGAAAQEKPAAGKDAARTGDESKDQAKPTEKEKESTIAPEDKAGKATFGGGCFWCLEAVFERVPGVKSVVSGYSGGVVANPTYEQVCSGLTGHAEVVQIEYDPRTVTFAKLLKVFWATHDPTSLNAQGPDIGTQYRSVILYHDEAQKEAALKSYKELVAARVYGRRRIVTDLVPLIAFFPAEPYHQDYFAKHPDSNYCQMMITPKLMKLHKMKLK